MGNQQPVSGQEPRGSGASGGGGYPPPPVPPGGAAGYNMPVPSLPPGGAYPPNFDAAMMPRNSSDTSMTMSDTNPGGTSDGGGSMTNAYHHRQQQHQGGRTSGQTSIENWLDDDTVPTVFRWEHGGRQVYITGTFNGWSRQIPMHRSGNDFTYIHNLKRGKHAFKFIVDDEWRFAPDQPTVADIEGRINNFIDVTDFKAYTGDRDFEKEKAAAEYGGAATDTVNAATAATAVVDEDMPTSGAGGVGVGGGSGGMGGGGVGGAPQPDRDGEVFSNNMPDVDDYTREPPPLPPHLRYIILNKPPQLQDTAALPVPQHVALNHLYCTAIKNNMMVLGITQRYKTKFVTTVYYAPCK